MSRLVYDSINDYVQELGGSRVIKRILIANNGNAAIKAIRSMRTWAHKTFGNERELEFVVMATIEDIEANAEYISEADYLQEVPSGTNNNNFANVALIVQTAEEHKCDAVWPGWGHASENFELPIALSKARRPIAWIGPKPSSMLALGDKIGSTIIAQSAEVPCVPWSGSAVTLPQGFNCLEELPHDLLEAACVKSAADVKAVCDRIGYPVMVKASEGGGGKGIRKVLRESDIPDAFRQVVNEVKGSPVFVMKMVSRCRHLEVQIFADEHGNAYSLGTRDCSIQRRSQKIIEEGNVVAAPPEIVAAMEDAAVRLAKKVGYTNAGTAEFLYDAETKQVYFCEVNARLQVEHVVTEVVDDINLPAAQLQVAMGIPIPKIPDVSRFLHLRDTKQIAPRHCIACRITAEHAEEGFRPTSGAVHEISFRSSAKVWGYFCIGAPGRIHAYADSQFGHIFSVGDTREDACANMLAALKSLVIRGEIRTNVEALMAILVSDDFLNLRTYTTWLEECLGFTTPLLSRRVQYSTLLAVMLASTYEAAEIFKASRAEFAQRMSQGQLPGTLTTRTNVDLVYKGVKFSVVALESGANSIILNINDSEVEVNYRHVNPITRDGGFLVSGGFDGRTRQVFRKAEPQGVSVTFEGATYSFTKEIDPTQVRAPMSGKLVRWLVDDGQECPKDTPFCEIEIMKMYMQLKLENAGKISHVLSEGAVFAAGDLLASLELPNGAAPPKITPFTGQFPPTIVAKSTDSNVLLQRRDAEQRLFNAVQGYRLSPQAINDAVTVWAQTLFEPSLAPIEFREVISVLGSQMPESLKKAMVEISSQIDRNVTKAAEDLTVSPLPFESISKAIETQLNTQALSTYTGPSITVGQLEPLLSLIKKYSKGMVGAALLSISNILTTFIQDEAVFANTNEAPQKVLQTKRTEFSTERSAALLLAHNNLKNRLQVVGQVLDIIKSSKALLNQLDTIQPQLTEIASFTKATYTPITARARQLQLIKISDVDETLASRIEALCADIQANVVNATGSLESRISTFLRSRSRLPALEDALLALTGHADSATASAAVGILVQYLFMNQDAQNFHLFGKGQTLDASSTSAAGASTTITAPLENLLLAANTPKSTAATLASANCVAAFTHRAAGIDSASVSQAQSLITGGQKESSLLSAANNNATSALGLSSGNDSSRLAQMLLAENDSSATSAADAANRHGTLVVVFNNYQHAIESLPAALKEVATVSSTLLSGVAAKHLIILIAAANEDTTASVRALKDAINASTIIKNHGFSVVTVGSQPASTPSDVDLVPQTFINWRHFHLATGALGSAISASATQSAVVEAAAAAASSGLVFIEGSLFNNVDPASVSALELQRLDNFQVTPVATAAPFVHIFDATPKGVSGAAAAAGRRFFVRVLMRATESVDKERFAEQERFMCVAINALESAIRACKSDTKEGNHILLSILPAPGNTQFRYSPAAAETAIRSIYNRYESRLAKIKVSKFEIRYPWGSDSNITTFVRLVVDNPTGQSVRVRVYKEVRNPSGAVVLSSVDNHTSNDDLENTAVLTPYPISSALTLKRALAAAVSTVYVYDFLTLLEQAIKDSWRAHYSPNGAEGAAPFIPDTVIEASELVLNARGSLEEVKRPVGQNTIGMVAWILRISTPEFPKGRRIIVIANDCTHQMGTFGVQEDLLYQRASELARKDGIPRIFLAANSGARMGIANEVLKQFRVEWVDPTDPPRGFRYLYVLPEEHARLSATDSIVTEPIEHPVHGKVFKITDVIGAESGLGVENLCGSGAIAGETSKAYKETFTLTYVTGRDVGIGAYVTRLGQRVIQKASDAPLLLTGYQALNRLVGRDVYSSNDEIGGIDVMHRNGITHEIVKDDLEGCKAIVRWLSFVADKRGGALPVVNNTVDPIGRLISVKPTSSTEDPRQLLTGCTDASGVFQGGFLDKGSFHEYLSDWAKAVIVGRGRIGGYPIGCICVETRVTEATQPADPAAPQTSEQTQVRAGQVWYPDSAFKTAQAIEDFNNEELPLIILANWRGFSGGQRDMFLEVLKFGSYIVDALVDFKQPCFVYIPPKGELRGGAWVCVDPRINPSVMEMFADEDSRGGVLEPTGTVEIKLRERQLIELAGRLDSKLISLAEQDAELSKTLPVDALERLEIKDAREKRIQELLPVYKQVALHFADLHDTSVRMKHKHAISESVQWPHARNYFYWRLRRQLIYFSVRSEVLKAAPSLTSHKAERLINSWSEEHFAAQQQSNQAQITPNSVEDSIRFVQWAKTNAIAIYQKIRTLRAQYIKTQVAEFLQEAPVAVWEALRELDPNRAQEAINNGETHGLASLISSINATQQQMVGGGAQY